MSTTIPTKKLCNGMQMPYVGLGTFKEKDENKLITAIKSAIQSGYRHFDCAYCYHNEQHIGRAIRESIAESNGQLKREDFFIVSKCFNIFHSKEKVKYSIDTCLERFGLDYLDCYLMHWPMGFKEDAGDNPQDENGLIIPTDVHYIDTYKYLEELVDQGKVKSIGVSNFNPEQLQDILNMCKYKPVCNQFEVHPLLQANEWVDFCQKNDVAVVAYAPFGAPDRFWGQPGDPVLLEQPQLLELAKKHSKSPAQIILRWLHQRDIIVIPKSVTPSRIQENANIFDFELTPEDMAVFKLFTQHFRVYALLDCKYHPFYPFKSELTYE